MLIHYFDSAIGHSAAFTGVGGAPYINNKVWNPASLTWEAETQPAVSGGAVTVANGADVAQGNTADIAWVSGSGTIISILKKISGNGSTAATEATLALVSGTDITTPSPAMPAGGVGIRGWLSAIWTKLNGSLAVTGTFFQATQPISGTVTANAGTGTLAVSGPLTDAQLRAAAVPVSLASITASVTPGTAAANLGKAEDVGHATGDTGIFVLGVVNDLDVDMVNANLDYIAHVTDRAGRIKTREGAQLIATTISAANAIATLTLAAAGAGLFHYITGVEIVNVNPTATAIAGSAVTLGYTSTNIPGAPAWTAGNALAAGVEKVVERIVYPGGIKTTAAATPTTFVSPAIGVGGLCRITVTYYIAP